MITTQNDYDKDFVKYVIEQVFTYFKIDKDIALTSNRSRDVSDARHMIWYLLHYNYDYSSFLIAKIFNKNRRSVMSGIANTKFFIENMPDDSNDYNNIIEKIEW